MARAKKERAKYVAVIESLDQEGRGVARRDGKVVFIEGALPGEKIEYEVYRSKPSFELGLTTEIYKESPLRVLPKCPYFGVKDGSCGGCAAGRWWGFLAQVPTAATAAARLSSPSPPPTGCRITRRKPCCP